MSHIKQWSFIKRNKMTYFVAKETDYETDEILTTLYTVIYRL